MLTRTELRHVIVMGLLAVLFTNACHVIAMQHVQSNTAALLNATPALWIAWLGTFGHRRSHLSGTARLGLLVGFAGVMLVLVAERRISPRRPRLAAPDPARLPLLVARHHLLPQYRVPRIRR